jgi:thiamine biosynthesis lipoprotein ApbE
VSRTLSASVAQRHRAAPANLSLTLPLSAARIAAEAVRRQQDADPTAEYEGWLTQLDEHVDQVVAQLDQQAANFSPKKNSELKLINQARKSTPSP